MKKKEFTIEDVIYMYDTVVKWNEFCGNMSTDKSLVPMYRDLTYVEFFGKNEFLQGYESNDLVMQLDGLGDLAYTTFFWDVLCASVATLALEEVFEQSTTFDADTHIKYLKVHLKDGYAWGIAYNLIKLLILYSETADIRGVFDAITVSNYSKVPLVSEVISDNHTLEDEVLCIEGQGRYKNVSYKLIDSKEGQRVVFLAGEDLQDGVVFDKLKIIKSKAFKEVEDLRKFIY